MNTFWRRHAGLWAMLTIVVLLVLDQWIKMTVKTGMCLGETVRVTDWFYIHFIENNGMAYGLSFIWKPALTVFRLVASAAICWYIFRQIKARARLRYVFLLSLLVAGAMGNAIDCMFYGMIFTESTPFSPAVLVPFGEGYAGFLNGKVVDMFYFPLIVTTWPDWMPLVGGDEFVFFSPVFNLADSCITVSVFALLIWCKKELALLMSDKKENET